MFILKKIEKLNDSERNFFSTNGSVFLYPKWMDLFPDNSIALVGIYDKNKSIIGGFCITNEKKFGKHVLRTPQFFGHNGLFYVNPAQTVAKRNTFDKKLMKAICVFLQKQNPLFISLGFPADIVDVQPFIWNNFNTSLKYTYRINLEQSSAEMLQEFSTERRKNITKATKDQLEVKLCNDASLVNQLVAKSIQRNEAPVDQSILKNIVEGFINSGNAFAFVAYANAQPLATVFIIHDNKTAYYLLGGFDSKNKHQGAGAICMWQAIQHSKSLGLTTFDFEGSMLPDVEKYFRGFGGKLVPLIQVHSANYLMQTLLKAKGNRGF